jgi:hypothetical protein
MRRRLNHQAIVAFSEDGECRFVSFHSGDEMIDSLTRRVLMKADVIEEGKNKAEAILLRAENEMRVFDSNRPVNPIHASPNPVGCDALRESPLFLFLNLATSLYFGES